MSTMWAAAMQRDRGGAAVAGARMLLTLLVIVAVVHYNRTTSPIDVTAREGGA